MYEREIWGRFSNGRDSVRSGVKELEGAGYVVKEYMRHSDMKYVVGIKWYIFERPSRVVKGVVVEL